jgi:uncharacterized protein (TIGR02246 family)
MNADETAVASILEDYQTALNGSDTEAALKLYAPDGLFMPQHSPSSVSTAALRQAYDAVFAAITLTVEFEIAEISADRTGLDVGANKLRRTYKKQCNRRRGSGSEPGAFSVPEDRRGLEDRALLFLHNQPAARLTGDAASIGATKRSKRG